MRNCAYVAHALTTNYYKIGITANIEKRICSLQTAVPFFEIVLVVAHYHEKYKEIERRLHWRYADKRIRTSEWFELTDADLATVTIDTSVLVDSLGLNNHKVDLHKLFPLRPIDGKATEGNAYIALEYLKNNLLEEKKDNTWASVARDYDVNTAVIWRIVNEDYNPKNLETRIKLGLSTSHPAISVPR